jgi:AcrR family transcriptional regulator
MLDTKQRILDTAERLFAERGYRATSLRSIIGEAGVNLAAVHYHFRSKEGLLDAVMSRRLEPVNRERLALLDECEREAGDGPPDLEKILEALIAPPLRVRRDPAFATFARLMGRVLTEGDVCVIRKHFGQTIERFMTALRKALPNLPAEELQWRAHFSLGCMAHTLLHSAGAVLAPGGLGQAPTETLVTFIAAGFRAPVPATRRSHA